MLFPYKKAQDTQDLILTAEIPKLARQEYVFATFPGDATFNPLAKHPTSIKPIAPGLSSA